MSFDEWEDQRPPKKRHLQLIRMEPLSVEELHELVAHLETEITRARAEISAKETLRGSAEDLFRR